MEHKKFQYIIDASSIISQKPSEQHDRRIYRSIWDNIERLIGEGVIFTSSEIESEVQDDSLIAWINSNKLIVVPLEDDIQLFVKDILKKNPKLVDIKNMKSSGDAFLIATALKYGATVISEENKKKLYGIPAVCKNMGIQCYNINELCEHEGWVF